MLPAERRAVHGTARQARGPVPGRRERGWITHARPALARKIFRLVATKRVGCGEPRFRDGGRPRKGHALPGAEARLPEAGAHDLRIAPANVRIDPRKPPACFLNRTGRAVARVSWRRVKVPAGLPSRPARGAP